MVISPDVMIAEKILGWTQVHENPQFGWEGIPPQMNKFVDTPIRIPEFTKDAAWDYLVLSEIRETWRGEQLQLFLGILFSIYNNRTKDPTLLFLQYIPGDYSQAALRVLELAS